LILRVSGRAGVCTGIAEVRWLATTTNSDPKIKDGNQKAREWMNASRLPAIMTAGIAARIATPARSMRHHPASPWL
jgi:hypothetical protein